MLFHSPEFIFVFLPITWAFYYFIAYKAAGRFAIWWLIIASLAFYAYWDPRYLILIVVSILVNFYLGERLTKTRSHRVLVFGVSLNLAVLFFFKYTNFILGNLNEYVDSRVPITHIVLPLGISFFTFQKIAFLVDAYRGEAKEYNLTKFSFFVTFFPQLIAGPIVHHKQLVPQLNAPDVLKIKLNNVLLGLLVFSMGLFKKITVADYFGEIATPIFKAASGADILAFNTAWIGALSYTFQLYFDFSGYSDMAVGLGLLFNLKLPINFNSPYKAVSISDFWRRWHITLSTFLRDYLYISLGGNRKGELIRYRNLFLTMLLGGIWHGAGWTFLIWGAWHGFLLVINHLWRRTGKDIFAGYGGVSFSWTLTFLCVVIGWVFFRAESVHAAWKILGSMFAISEFLVASQWPGLGALIFALVMVLLLPNSNQVAEQIKAGRFPFWIVLGVSVMVAYTLYNIIYGRNDVYEFLYFDF